MLLAIYNSVMFINFRENCDTLFSFLYAKGRVYAIIKRLAIGFSLFFYVYERKMVCAVLERIAVRLFSFLYEKNVLRC